MAPIYAQNLLISDEVLEDFYSQPNSKKELIGWVEAELSKSNTQLKRYQHIGSSILAILLVLGFFGFIIIRSSYELTAPISNILHTLKELENGQLESRVHINGNSEFSQLAAGVNAMASALQRSNIEYHHNIEQATRDLQETLDEMEIRNSELQIGRREALEASTMKSEFLANVSHEIRTPLHGIIGFTELLTRTHLSTQQSSYLATITKSSEDLLKILNDILDLSKIDAGKLIVEAANINLRDILEDVLLIMAPEAANKGLELNYLLYSDVPIYIRTDSLRLKQVLTNLLSNAIKFTKHGGINLRISAINVSEYHASIRFEIQDSGIGMSDEQIGRIFTPFSQADTSTTRKFGGTGLGLVISRALVEAMGGEIRVTSQLGHGSTFSFHIEVELQQQVIEEFPALSDHYVALIDGTMLSRINTTNLLSSWHLQHDDFETVAQLLASHKQGPKPWQMILLALANQRPDDPRTQEQIQQLLDLNLPIVAATNLLHHEDTEAFKKLGIPYLITHPCTRKNLNRLVRMALQLPALDDGNKNKALPNTQQKPLILVVDDNPANLKLVTTLLEELNLRVLAATSGQEAIDFVENQPVDLVFMDIQMPIMNGLEATRRIRALSVRNTLPVVALTAHAMADEKEALLKAGMNDYQTKPINQSQLINCIERWTGYRCQLPDKPALMQNTVPVFDDIFDASLALFHANQKPELANELFTMLLSSLPQETKLIMDAWEMENYETLLELVHKLHGACRYCGVPRLLKSLEELETALKTGHVNKWPDLLRAMVENSAHLQHWASSNEWQLLLNEASA